MTAGRWRTRLLGWFGPAPAELPGGLGHKPDEKEPLDEAVEAAELPDADENGHSGGDAEDGTAPSDDDPGDAGGT
jgi:hypothetical protein